MKNWYQTRDKITGSQHRGQELQPNKFVKMTDKQAAQHNKASDPADETSAKERASGKEEPSLIKADKPPESVADCQFADEYEVIQEEKPKQDKRSNAKRES